VVALWDIGRWYGGRSESEKREKGKAKIGGEFVEASRRPGAVCHDHVELWRHGRGLRALEPTSRRA
jgi:hypothetical protein